MSENRFVFFGCWNSLNKNTNLENTMTTLKTHLKENSEISFVVVGGDNFYPDKSKKKEEKKKDDAEKKEKKEKKDTDAEKKDKCTKIINLNNLTNGFNLLPQEIPIYMLLGNHDLETNAVNEKKICIYNGEDDPIVEPPNTCTILQHEKHLVSNLNNITLGTNFARHMSNTLLLMIDTSMYDTKESESYIPCYQRHRNQSFNQPSTDTYIQELRIFQNAWILNEVNISKKNRIQNIIIMGHHPITGHKVKDNMCILTKLEQPFVEMWQSVLDIIVDPDIRLHYLCADIHNYQHSIIHFTTHLTKPIHQYIVGTGGTELDANKHSDCPKSIQSGNTIITYNLQDFNNENHGFLDCDCSGERPVFRFIPTINPMKAEGKNQRKTKKNKKRRKALTQKPTRKPRK